MRLYPLYSFAGAAFLAALAVFATRGKPTPPNSVKPTVVRTITYYNPKQDKITTPLSTPAPRANYQVPMSEGEASDVDEEPPLPPVKPKAKKHSDICARHNLRKVWVNSRSWRCRR